MPTIELLAQVESLQKENERLRKEIAELKAEIKRLQDGTQIKP